MFCPKCGTQMADDAQFCPSCGHRTDQPAEQPQSPEGSAATQPMAPAAPTAPTAAPPPPAPAAAPTQPSGGGGRTCWIIGCVLVLLVVVLAVGGFFGVRWWMARNTQGPPQPVQETQTDEGEEVVEPEEGETEGGVHLDDEGQARQLVMDLFSMWSQGDEEGIKDIATPAMLVGTEDWDFSEPYEQYGVEIASVEETEEDRWLFVVEETYEDGEGGRQTTEYKVEVWKRHDGFRISHLGTPGDGYYDGGAGYQPTQEDEDADYHIALATVHLFFIGWKNGDLDAVRKQMSADMMQRLSDDDRLRFSIGYEQVSMIIEDASSPSEDLWLFTVRETYRPEGTDESHEAQESRYRLHVRHIGPAWQLDQLEYLSGQDED